MKIIIDLISLPKSLINKYNIKVQNIGAGSPGGNEYTLIIMPNQFEAFMNEAYGPIWEAHYKNGIYSIYA
jgi:hypothetical protein